MTVTETLNEGLRRDFRIVVEKTDLEGRLLSRLDDLKGKIQLKGFRPGKVPVAFLRKTYGKALMQEIVQETVTQKTDEAIRDKALKPALQPRIEFPGQIDPVLEGAADLEFTVSVEVIPDFAVAELAQIAVVRPVLEVADEDVAKELERIAEQTRSYAAKDGAADKGDAVVIDFEGSIDGVPFEGGKGEGFQLVLGSGQFIPGFEDQLVGAAAGESRTVNVTFPAAYRATELAGKDAAFAVTVKEVKAPEQVAMDDTLAQKIGLESLEQLKDQIRAQIRQAFAQASRAHLKRRLLDALDAAHSFELPPTMVEAEFGAIWRAVEAEMQQEGKTPADEGKTEDELKAEYRAIAERRVRLGLVIGRIGELNNIQVTNEELQRGMIARARQFPGQERQVIEFYQKNPQALAEIRAPIFEDKVVDFIAELAKVSERAVSRDDLFADPDDLIQKEKAA